MERTDARVAIGQRLPLASLAGLFALGAAVVHFLVMPEHFQEWWGYGVFFLVLAILQVLYGLGLLLPRMRFAASPSYLLTGILGAMMVMVMYVISRSLGVPLFGPHAGHVEEMDALGLLSKGLELGQIICLSGLLLRIHGLGRRFWASAGIALAASLLLTTGLVFAGAATSPAREQKPGLEALAVAPRENSINVIRQYDTGAASSRDLFLPYLTINVYITDAGIQPPIVEIPAGQLVQLVLRNRGSAEYHYRVLGLVPKDLLFVVPQEEEDPLADPVEVAAAPPEAGEDHAHDHGVSFVESRSVTTPAGVRVTGDRVHAWAEAGGVDTVIFSAAKQGTYVVQDPRHREIVGKLIVN